MGDLGWDRGCLHLVRLHHLITYLASWRFFLSRKVIFVLVELSVIPPGGLADGGGRA